METFTTVCIRTTCQLSVLYLLVWTSFSSAFPASVSIRSSQNATPGNLGVGILCNAMMSTSDYNGDGKLSSAEIQAFYSGFYPAYVAQLYGQEFVRIADMDNDGNLDQTELLQMLIAIDASSTTRR